MSSADPYTPRVRPAGWWYALVPVIVIAGIVVGIMHGVDQGRRIASSFHNFGYDGAGSVQLSAGDEPTVWAVYPDGRSTDGLSRPDANVQVTGPDGKPVEYHRRSSNGRTTWSSGTESGIDLGTFRADTDGRYDVKVTYTQTSSAPGPVVAAGVGNLDLSKAIGEVLRPIGLGCAAAIALFIVLLVLRGGSKRRIRRMEEPQSPLGVPTSVQSPPTPTPSSSSGPFV